MTIEETASKVMELLAAAPRGLPIAAMRGAMGLRITAAGDALRRLIARGMIVRLGGDSGTRYTRYCTPQHESSAIAAIAAERLSVRVARQKRADDVRRAKLPDQKPKVVKAKAVRVEPKPQPATPAKPGVKISKAKWIDDGPADFSRARHQKCKSGKDHRHTFDGEPGRHVDATQARPWARAVAP